MAHLHPVYDSDPHFSIDPDSRAITYLSQEKLVIIQSDHNSERFTFELPRLIDGHDMTLCNLVQVHYINIDSANSDNRNTGVYKVEDLQVSPDDENVVVCSWLISNNATQLVGSLNFVLRFACTTGSKVDYAWNTAVFSGISISTSINNSEETVEQYSDILESWYLELIAAGTMGVNIVDEAKANALAEIENVENEVIKTKDAAVTEVNNAKTTAISEINEAKKEFSNLVFSSIKPTATKTVGYTMSMADNGIVSFENTSETSDKTYRYGSVNIGTYGEYKGKKLLLLLEKVSGETDLSDMKYGTSDTGDFGWGYANCGLLPSVNTNEVTMLEIAVPTDKDDASSLWVVIGNSNTTVFPICKFNIRVIILSDFSIEDTIAKLALDAKKAELAKTAENAKIAELARLGKYFISNDAIGTRAVSLTNRNEVEGNLIKHYIDETTNAKNWHYGFYTYCLGKKEEAIKKKIVFKLNSGANIINTIGLGDDLAFASYKMDKDTKWHTIDIAKAVEESTSLSSLTDIYFTVGYQWDRSTITDNGDGTYTNPAAYIELLFGETFGDITEKQFADELIGFDENEYYNKETPYIICWGDSLTAMGGWTEQLAELSGMTLYNAGVGGENSNTIMARQGADSMVINNITIPATVTPIIIATDAEDGVPTICGKRVKPALQALNNLNPVKIGEVEGSLAYDVTAQNWTFTRTVVGSAVTINRPTVIRTNHDIAHNAPYLMVIFMGQNDAKYDSSHATIDKNIVELIQKHRAMIDHAKAKNFIVLGLSSGTTESRASYEAEMKKEFGSHFISLREYLANPIYDDSGNIISCYGIEDIGETAGTRIIADNEYVASGMKEITVESTIAQIANGETPYQLLRDSVHYRDGSGKTREIIGNYIYKRCVELGIF